MTGSGPYDGSKPPSCRIDEDGVTGWVFVLAVLGSHV